MTSEFSRFTGDVVKNLAAINLPLEWLGINDEKLIGVVTSPELLTNGIEFQEPWDFLAEDGFQAAQSRTIAHITRLCVADHLPKIDRFAASADEMGGGSVLMEFGSETDMAAVPGGTLIDKGFIGHNKLGARRWTGLALSGPEFGLTCLLREVTASPPPYCEAPWVTGFEWFIQGLSEPIAKALSDLR